MTSEFKIPLHRFDLNLLPADARQIGSEAFKMAVSMHFAAEYAASGQNAIVTVDDKEIGVMTYPRDADALDMIMPMLKAGKLAEGVPYLRNALALMPDDPQSIYGLALGLSDLDTADADREADGLFNRIIKEHPTSPVVEQAEKARTRLAHKGLQEGAVGGLRLDVVAYITDALRTFDKVGPKDMQRIALEIALKGQSGLDINNPAKQYTLKSLPGEFSGLQLLAIMYAAFQKVDPTADLGADFSGEYAVALKAVKRR